MNVLERRESIFEYNDKLNIFGRIDWPLLVIRYNDEEEQYEITEIPNKYYEKVRSLNDDDIYVIDRERFSILFPKIENRLRWSPIENGDSLSL